MIQERKSVFCNDRLSLWVWTLLTEKSAYMPKAKKEFVILYMEEWFMILYIVIN